MDDSILRFLCFSKTPAQNTDSPTGAVRQQQTWHNTMPSSMQERLFSPFPTCDTPGISSPPHPEGESIVCMYKLLSVCKSARFSFPAEGPVFFDFGGRARRGYRLYTARNFGPRPGFVALALDCQSRGELALSAGSFPRSQSQPDPWKPPECDKLMFCALLLSTSSCYKYHNSPQTLYTSTQPRYNSRRSSCFSFL